MASSSAALKLPTSNEDVLAHLPVSGTMEYWPHQLIYGPKSLSQSIYLVMQGNVVVSRVADDGSELLMEIVRPDELFGESAFLEPSRRFEQAKAMDRDTVMAWAVSDIEVLVTKRPRLAVALLQVFAQRNAELTRRIQSFAADNIQQRLARSLLRLSERLGTPEEDGSVRMMPFTHALLSQYVGTSREIVTLHMNRFRKQGYVNYSRDRILLYRDTLRKVLD